jgi:TraB/PrgY/gumN family
VRLLSSNARKSKARESASLNSHALGLPIEPLVHGLKDYLEENRNDAQRHTLLPIGESSEQRVPAELWATIKAAWPESQGALGRQKLWLIAISLGFSGVPSQHGVEHFITERAKGDSRIVRYLETGAEFSQLMDSMADIEYHKAFAVILRSNAQTRAQSINDMYWAWMSGRVDRLMETLQKSPMAQFPMLREMIFDRRNWLWLPRIVAILVTRRPTVCGRRSSGRTPWGISVATARRLQLHTLGVAIMGRALCSKAPNIKRGTGR